MSKTFVLRAGSIISSVDATLRFGGDNTIVVPMAVLQHVYEYRGIPEKQRIAQRFVEYIGSIPKKELLSKEGYTQSNGSKLKLVDNPRRLSPQIEAMVDFTRMDKRVYQVCLDLKEEGWPNVILISRNPVIRFKACEIGIEGQNFKDELFPSPKDQYKGYADAFVTEKNLSKMFNGDGLKKEDIYRYEEIEWYENLFLNIKSESSSALGRYSDGIIHPIMFSKTLPNGYKALNLEQKMLWECLLAPPEIAPLVVVKGAAGTGKTFCALAMALENLAGYSDKGIYDQILVATPMVTVSNESMGFLPGDIDEKVGPYLGGILDNLKAIFREKSPEDNNRELKDRAKDLFDREFIEIQPIGFLHGRTIPRTVFIIDETQNIKPSDIKDIATRAAKGSKFIFLGDPTQINNTELNQRYNGLVYLSEKMKGDPLCWQVTLSDEKSVRGDLAQAALSKL